MVKKLLIITNTMNQGGAESFLMKVYRSIDKSKYQFDFYIMGEKGFFDKEILSMGGNIFYGEMKTRCFSRYKKKLKNLFQKNKYDAVFRSMAHSFSFLDLYYAKKYSKTKNAIARSTNTYNSKPCLHKIIRPINNLFSDTKMAPSTEAGIFMFGKKSLKKGCINILPNGIDTIKFKFSNKIREEKRNELRIKKSELLFLHVGRFTEQKNHEFLINVFFEITRIHSQSKLICIGGGELKRKIEESIKKLELLDKVFFLEKIKDVETFCNAADLMIFPSLFEGLPNVVMEAQGSSLPVIASDTITKECKVTELVNFLPLGNEKQWAESCIKTAKKYKKNLTLRENIIFPKELDINKVAEKFIEIVFK